MTETKTLDRRSQYSVDAIQNALFTLLEEKNLFAKKKLSVGTSKFLL